MVKISIVIPVFNAENFIIKCLESIINQTFSNYEIILINDGSTDGTITILNQYLDSNNKIILINQENQGQSIARNEGIKVSKGKYLMFVDNDDFLYNNFVLEEMYNDAESHNADVLMGNIICSNQFNQLIIGNIDYSKIKESEHKTGAEFFVNLCKLHQYYCNIYGKLYSADLIKNNNLYFVARLINEDEIWTPQVYYFAKNVKFVDKPFYNRYLHENSQTRIINETSSFRKASGRLIVITELINFLNKKNASADFRKCLNSIFVGFFFTSINYYALDLKDLVFIKKMQLELKKTFDQLVVFNKKSSSKNYKLEIIKIIGLQNFLISFPYLKKTQRFFK
jgi:glycosyltransferase involved in cell wall biosynthesis